MFIRLATDPFSDSTQLTRVTKAELGILKAKLAGYINGMLAHLFNEKESVLWVSECVTNSVHNYLGIIISYLKLGIFGHTFLGLNTYYHRWILSR